MRHKQELQKRCAVTCAGESGCLCVLEPHLLHVQEKVAA
jgi:hypothetical protein